MKFETLKKNHNLKIVVGVVVIIAIAMVGIFATSRAKYRNTQSIPLVRGIINYKVPDFTIVAIYQQKEGQTCTEENCYEEKEVMPGNDYAINEEKSYCTLKGVEDTSAKLYTNDDGEHIIANLNKDDKCYLYFDKPTTKKVKTVLGTLTVNLDTPDFSKTSCSSGCGEVTVGIYETTDETGNSSYYYRGDVTNNYLKFAGKYWRIIRINGDGTIRIIYDGTEYHANGTSTSDSIAVALQKFNTSYDNAIYVGFKYGTTEEGRGLTNKSNALTQLETWYTNNLASYASLIDTNAGFCGDRTAYTDEAGTTAGTGYGTTTQYFADYVRLETNKAPVLTCANSDDLYTVTGASQGNKSLEYPIGLINANEVAMAGGVHSNKSYYLYNGQSYWTMSPYEFNDGYARVFTVTNFSGRLSFTHVFNSKGLRPVINLSADVTITGEGTQNSPYEVS